MFTNTSRSNHSQNQEQTHILAAFEGRPVGRFIDIGAWHATQLSNTRALYELGWSGVLVEPSPVPFAGLVAEYGGVDRIALINAAVVLEPTPDGMVSMHVTEDAVSTTSAEMYEKWKGIAKYTGEIEVAAITLDAIVEDHGPFDFLNLDAEGLSVDLLVYRVFALDPLPRCICVEYDSSLPEILSRATELGYVATYVSGENVVLVRA